MRISNVSFGSINAVYGNPRQLSKITRQVAGKAMIKDVTDTYKKAKPSGILAQAANQGNTIKLYITGMEKNCIEKGKAGWTSMNDILQNIKDYYDANRTSISEIANTILNK